MSHTNMFDLGYQLRFPLIEQLSFWSDSEKMAMNTATEETRTELHAQMAELSAQIAELRSFFSNEPLAYGVAAACEAAQLSRPTLQRAINDGRLRIRRSGRKVLIDRDELRRFIEALPTKAQTD